VKKDCLTGIATVSTKRLNFLIFQLPKTEKDHCALGQLVVNWQFKNKEAL
jgi:hypothetical protein